MLQFLKQLFSSKPKEVKVAFSELEEWLDTKAGPFREQLESDIKHIIDEVQKESKNIITLLDDLEKASLQNPNIPNRAKTIMKGNRDAFSKALSRFFSDLHIPFEGFDQVKEYSKKVQKEMDTIANSTSRSYAILTQFFAREVSAITDTIKKIDGYLKDIVHLIEDNTLTKIKELKAELAEIKNKTEKKERHHKEKKETEEQVQKTEKDVESHKSSIKEKKAGSLFKEYESLISKKHEFEKKLKEVEDSLFHDFSGLDKALKKYSKIAVTHEALAESYLKNSITALMKDEKLEIVTLLENMKKAAEGDKLDLEDKKKEKAVSKIQELTKEHFESLQKKYKEAQKHLTEVLDSIESNTSKKEIELLEKELSKAEKDIEKFRDAIKEIDSEIEKIDISKLKKNLEASLNAKLKETAEKIVVH